MPRCCSPVPEEFAPTYASVVVGDLEAKVLALERGPLVPCVTSWCAKCCRPYLLTTCLPLFHSPSAHHAHMVALSKILQGS